MEAITALEERVNEVVFRRLESHQGLPSNLIRWLREQTRSKFDSRLSPLGEFALGNPLDKSGQLWGDYKTARKLRNEVSHTARVISASEASFVLETVRRWLHFLDKADLDDAPQQWGGTRGEFLRFLERHSVLVARFRFLDGSGRPVPPLRMAEELRRAGTITGEQADALLLVTDARNRIAHHLNISSEQFCVADEALSSLLRDWKGVEFGPLQSD